MVKLTGKHLCQSLFLNKVVGLSLQPYLKSDSCTGVAMSILAIFKTPFLQNTSGRLPLKSASNNVILDNQNFSGV